MIKEYCITKYFKNISQLETSEKLLLSSSPALPALSEVNREASLLLAGIQSLTIQDELVFQKSLLKNRI